MLLVVNAFIFDHSSYMKLFLPYFLSVASATQQGKEIFYSSIFLHVIENASFRGNRTQQIHWVVVCDESTFERAALFFLSAYALDSVIGNNALLWNEIPCNSTSAR